MSDKLAEVLEERGSNYGDYTHQTELSQGLKNLCFEHLKARNPEGERAFEPHMIESMEMVLHKIARIFNGDPLHLDSWRDIAGYATLSADRIEAALKGEPPLVRGAVSVHAHLHGSSSAEGPRPEVRTGVPTEG